MSLLVVVKVTGDALVPAATKTSPPYDWAPVVLIAEFSLIAVPVTVKDGNVKPLETVSWDDVEVALNKVYPSAILRNYYISSVNYGDPYIHVGAGDGFTK